MRDQFRNRKYHLWWHPQRLNVYDRAIAGELARSSSVQERIDKLEALLPPEQRSSVSVLIVILDKPVPGDVVIELRGTTEQLTVIRDQVTPDFLIDPPYHRRTETPSLHFPMERITDFAREAAPL